MQQKYRRIYYNRFSFILLFLVIFQLVVLRTFSQGAIVRGNVKDMQNTPLIGVNVVQKGTSRGTVTDFDGNFTLDVPLNSILSFSYIGFKNVEIRWDGSSPLHIVMEEDSETLDEVVVVGAYGTAQKRSDMVGSAYQVNSERIRALPAARIDNLLEGLVPGLQISPNTDAASSTKQRLNIRVRGEGSMSASNEPLWVVDGTPMFTGDRTNMISGMGVSISPLTYLNRDDIESITILKDASATSIYGANGANGVILITTKKGVAGRKTEVSVSVQTGISNINQNTKFKVLDANQYMTLARESYLNSGRDMAYFPFQDNDLNTYSTTNTDWSKVFYDTGFNTNTNLSIRGGSSNVNYYVSGGYYNNQSTIIGNDQQRFSIRSNITLKMSEKFDFSVRYFTSYNTNNYFNPGSNYYEFLPIYSSVNFDGTFRLYNKSIDGVDAFGNPNWRRTRFLNSVAVREENDYIQRTWLNNVNVLLDFSILPGLTSTTQFGVDAQNANEETYSAQTNWSGLSTTSGPVGYSNRRNSTSFMSTGIQRLNYRKEFKNNQRIDAIAGFEIKSSVIRTLGAYGSGFINDRIKEVSYAVDSQGTSGRNTTNTLSYFGQASYAYNEKYFLTLNGRRDGVSGFGSDSQWGNFASVGGSWNIHSEDFFDNERIDILKLKASFGSNGNSRIGTQEALGIYSYGQSYNYMGQLGAAMSGSPNKKLSWETAYMTNVGLRIKLFKKLDIEIEAYNKKTVNLLSNLDVSRTTGDTRSYRNSGEILNQGIEITANMQLIDKKDYGWWMELNASHNKNKLLKLYNGIEKVMGNFIWREGHDLNTYYLIRWAGVDPRDGMPLWYDAKGNVTRTYDINNRVAWKSSAPILAGGFTTGGDYKNFSANILFTYVFGGYSFSSFGRDVMSDGLNIMDDNQSVNQLDRWQNPGDVALSPKPIWGVSTRSVMNSTRYIYKTTNVRLKNIALNYTLPPGMVRSLGASGCTVSLIGDNLLIWTPYDKKGRNSYKQSMSGYPMETTFSLGLNLLF